MVTISSAGIQGIDLAGWGVGGFVRRGGFYGVGWYVGWCGMFMGQRAEWVENTYSKRIYHESSCRMSLFYFDETPQDTGRFKEKSKLDSLGKLSCSNLRPHDLNPSCAIGSMVFRCTVLENRFHGGDGAIIFRRRKCYNCLIAQ